MFQFHWKPLLIFLSIFVVTSSARLFTAPNLFGSLSSVGRRDEESLIPRAATQSNVQESLESPALDPDAKRWALLIAGSTGYGNYRHQADVCHAYQLLLRDGIPASNIVVFVYDDIAFNVENPRPGQIINSPRGEDLYAGMQKDYTGPDVNANNFLAALLGNSSALSGIGSGRAIESGEKDHVFVYYTDHGGPGILGMPSFPFLFAEDLVQTLWKKHQRKGFKELVFYLEACESGSIFQGLLPPNVSVYATTAANAEESSWGTYCPGMDPAPPPEFETCLGDLYSVAWMEDSDTRDLRRETLDQQYKVVRFRTSENFTYMLGSHVMRYGSVREMKRESVEEYLGFDPVNEGKEPEDVDVPDWPEDSAGGSERGGEREEGRGMAGRMNRERERRERMGAVEAVLKGRKMLGRGEEIGGERWGKERDEGEIWFWREKGREMEKWAECLLAEEESKVEGEGETDCRHGVVGENGRSGGRGRKFGRGSSVDQRDAELLYLITKFSRSPPGSHRRVTSSLELRAFLSMRKEIRERAREIMRELLLLGVKGAKWVRDGGRAFFKNTPENDSPSLRDLYDSYVEIVSALLISPLIAGEEERRAGGETVSPSEPYRSLSSRNSFSLSSSLFPFPSVISYEDFMSRVREADAKHEQRDLSLSSPLPSSPLLSLLSLLRPFTAAGLPPFLQQAKERAESEPRRRRQVVAEVSENEGTEGAAALLAEFLFGTFMNVVPPEDQPLVEDWSCFKEMVLTFELQCVKGDSASVSLSPSPHLLSAPSNYAMGFSRLFANLCNAFGGGRNELARVMKIKKRSGESNLVPLEMREALKGALVRACGERVGDERCAA